MRRAHTDTGWVLGENNTLIGLSLGFDFCAEHEYGAEYIKAAMGIAEMELPIGIEDRTMTSLHAEDFGFVEYKTGASKKDARLSGIAHALLYLSEKCNYGTELAKTYKDFVSLFDVGFYKDCTSKDYTAERDDLAVSWSGRSGFAVHVRGAENVARLKQIHQAMLDLDVALMDGSVMGFLRKAMALVIVKNAPAKHVEKLKELDLANKRLIDAAKASGVEDALKHAGLGFYALKPGWRGRVEAPENLEFFLNPVKQNTYAFGWFSVADLKDWTQGKGPVVDGLPAKVALEKSHGKDFRYNVIKHANEVGLGLHHVTEVWLDEAKTQAGLRALFAKDKTRPYADGAYSIEQLHAMCDAVVQDCVDA